jgi:pimeloyl-ACP methyl ester carboxylesterase
VHGAFADGSMWAGVITELQAVGIDAVAVSSPLRSLTSDAAFEEKSPAAWKTAPSWYIVATADQLIPPEGQQFMAARAGAHSIEVDASHPIALTQPTAVAEHIATAASSASRRRHDRPT